MYQAGQGLLGEIFRMYGVKAIFIAFICVGIVWYYVWTTFYHKDAAVLCKNAITQYNKGDYGEAFAQFRAVKKEDPKNIDAHYYAALCEMKLGHPAYAVSNFRWVIDEPKAHKDLKDMCNQVMDPLVKRNTPDNPTLMVFTSKESFNELVQEFKSIMQEIKEEAKKPRSHKRKHKKVVDEDEEDTAEETPKYQGNNPVYDPDDIPEQVPAEPKDEMTNILNSIKAKYSNKIDFQLVDITHASSQPFQQAYAPEKIPCAMILDKNGDILKTETELNEKSLDALIQQGLSAK